MAERKPPSQGWKTFLRNHADGLDHVIVFGEQHLRHLLRCYVNYYNRSRTHLSLNKDAPMRRPVHAVGCIEARPVLGGLHHCYVRI